MLYARLYVLACLLALTMSVSAPPPSVASPLAQDSSAIPSTVAATGTIVVIPHEPRSLDEPGHEASTGPGSTGSDVYLETRSGRWLELTGAATSGVTTGSEFAGRLGVPAALRREAVRGSARPSDSAIVETAARLKTPMPVTAAEITAPAATTAAPMAHAVDVLYLYREGDKVPDSGDVQGPLNRLSEFWTSQSGGQITRVTRARNIEIKRASDTLDICDAQKAWTYARGLFGTGGEPSPYTAGTGRHLVVIVPGSRCGIGRGEATLSGDIHRGGLTWASIPENEPVYWDQVIFHEIGHNLGLRHSAQRTCPPGVVDAPTTGRVVAAPCVDTSYRDFYDVMGGGYYEPKPGGGIAATALGNIAALNATQRAALASLPFGPTGIRQIALSGGQAQTVLLPPAASASGLRALQLVDPTTNETIYVEYRFPTGRDSNTMYATYQSKTGRDTYAPGVRFLRPLPTGSGSSSSTALSRVDSSGTARMWWPSGSSFTTYNDAVSVRVNSTTSSGASLSVTFAPVSKFTTVPKPVITGTRVVDSILSATGAAASSWAPSASSVAYQWLRNGQPIPGATSQTYRAQAEDVGASLRVQATGSRKGVVNATGTSDGASVSVARFTGVGKPVISGTPTVGALQSVSGASQHSWVPTADAVSYQWLRNGTPIPSAVASTYRATSADLGASLTVRVTASRAGYVGSATISPAVRIVSAVFSTVPTPIIVGARTVGSTLTAERATATYWIPTASSVSYVWLRNNSPIGGATSQTYVVPSKDAGAAITVRVTAFRSGAGYFSSTSAATIIESRAFSGVPRPVITGTPTVGSTVAATGAGTTSWTPTATNVTYQWLRNNSVIPGATAQTYRAVEADGGATLTVRATGHRDGYLATAGMSAAVKVSPDVPRPNATTTRIFGSSRYATAIATSREGFPVGRSAPVLYLASATSWQDSVAASAAAEYQQGSMLLVPATGTVPAEVIARIKELAPSKVVIVGDTRHIADSVVAQVAAARPTSSYTRIQSADTAATSRAVTEYAFASRTGATVWIVDARTYGEAAIAAGAAGQRKDPVLLVDGSRSTLDAATLATIAKLKPSRMFVIGGASSISTGIERQVKATTPTVRIGGRDQYETANAINAIVFRGAWKKAYLVSGENWIEATTIGVSATRTVTPVYLTRRDCVPAKVLAEFVSKKTEQVVVVGGGGSVATPAAKLTPCR